MGENKTLLVIRDKVLLAAGQWNGVDYPPEVVEAGVKTYDATRQEPRAANDASLFLDHQDGASTWVGDVRGLRWDAARKAAVGDLHVVDSEVAHKLAYQQERGFFSWGVSPKLDVDVKKKTAVAVRFRGFSLVLDPAQGEKAMLEIFQPAGF